MSDDHENSLTVYRSDTRLHDAPFGVLRAMAGELWRHRWHISTKYRNDFKSRFNQTALGAIWQFVEPLLPISAYALLAYIAVFPTRDDMPALVYISIGITLWMLMVEMINRQIAAVQSNAAILNRTKYPLTGVLAAAFAQSTFETLVRIVAVAVIFALMVGAPPWRAIIALPMFVPMMLFAVGVGMILAVTNAVYRDVENIAGIIFRYGFFLSLTIFPLPAHPAIERFLWFNPFAVFIEAIRSALVFGDLPDPILVGAWSFVSILVFLVGCKLVYTMEPRLKGFL
ncbi:ABC transporter permease [Maricaulaceae bacterium NA33B04]|nr:ABC transporter permease [Maricaulaceae bacterium NA33B04]